MSMVAPTPVSNETLNLVTFLEVCRTMSVSFMFLSVLKYAALYSCFPTKILTFDATEYEQIGCLNTVGYSIFE